MNKILQNSFKHLKSGLAGYMTVQILKKKLIDFISEVSNFYSNFKYVCRYYLYLQAIFSFCKV